MRTLAPLTLLAALAVALPVSAEEVPSWGLVAKDRDGNYLVSHWPNDDEIKIGSGPRADLKLPGLKKQHLTIKAFDGEQVYLIPEPGAPVYVDGDRITAAQYVDAESLVGVGPYTLTLVRTSIGGDGEAYASDEPKIDEGAGDTEGEAEEHDAPESVTPVPEQLPPLNPGDAADRAAAARGDEFDKSGYAFCHDPDYGQDGMVGADFCVIFDETSDDVCPEARKSCKEWREHVPGSGSGTGGVGSGKGKGKGKGKSGERHSRTARRSSPIRIPAPPPIVGWVVIAVILGGLLFWFVRSLLDAGWEKDPKLDIGEVTLDEAARNLQSLPEAKATVLIKLAERAYGRGDAVEAAILLHLAVLRFLDDEGLARYHPSKTNGDYLRAIRRTKPLAALLRGVANQTERVRFGDGKVDGEQLPELLRAARELLVKGSSPPDLAQAAGPATASVLLLATGLAFSSQACGEMEDPSHAYYEYGPSGMSALPDMLEQAGFSVRVGRDRFADVPRDVSTVVLRSSSGGKKGWPADLKLDALLDRGLSVVLIDDAGRAPLLFPVTATISSGKAHAVSLDVFADTRVMCLGALVGLDEQAGIDPVRLPAGARLGVLDETMSSTSGISSLPLELHSFIGYAGAEHGPTGLLAPGVALVAARVDDDEGEFMSGCLYLFADRDLFSNASLTRAPNARFVAQFFARISTSPKILLLDRLDKGLMDASEEGGAGGAGGGSDPTRAIKSSNMLPFLIQSFVTLALLYVFLGAAFGRLRDRAKREHKSFVEHVEAIGRHYAASGTQGLNHSAQSLAKLVVMRNREKVRGGQAGGWAGLATDLARKYEMKDEDVRAALRLGIEGVSDLGAPRPEDPAPASERMLKTLSRLLSGRSEMLSLKRVRGRRSRGAGR